MLVRHSHIAAPRLTAPPSAAILPPTLSNWSGGCAEVTPIVFVAASVVCQVVAQNLMRAVQAGSRSEHVSVLSNYAIALVLAGAYCAAQGAPTTWWKPVAAGVFTGSFYTAGLFLFLGSMNQRGLAVSSAVSSTSALVPIGLAILLGERPAVAQVAGMAVALAAMPMLSLATASGKAIREQPRVGRAVVFFVVQGGAMSGNLLAFRFLAPASLPFYLVALFGWGTLLSLAILLARPRASGPGDVRRGAVLGLFNLASTLTIVTALGHVEGFLFFAVAGVLILVGNVGLGAWIWRERVGRLGWAGFALAAVAMVLLNLK